MGFLDGKMAVVAGAGSEFAFPLARTLAGAGARLALVAGDQRTALRASDCLQTDGIDAHAYAAGVTAKAVTQTLAAIVADLGQPHVLLTCPTDAFVAPSVSFPEDAFRAAFEGSTVHAFLWCQAVGRLMLEAGTGVIVNVSGLSGMGGWPGWAGQSAALAGVHNLTHTLATEWSRFGVRVNCLVPGITEEEAARLMQTPEAPDMKSVLERIPLGRLVSYKDLGSALLYLVRPGASFISGEVLRVDGAWDVWGRYYAVDPLARRQDSVRR